MVLDQTHNPGGDITYAEGIVSLFANGVTRNVVNFLRADRRWLSFFGDLIADPSATGELKSFGELGYRLVEDANEKGRHLTETPVPLLGVPYIKPAAVTWRKPVLLLIDELAGSCGDIVPMLMKANGLARLFSERTMGLGGNVEKVLTLPVSQSAVNLTRGFFAVFSPEGNYDLTTPIENNGVTPEIHYSHTVSDFRSGFFGYVGAFSKAAAEFSIGN